MDITKVTEINKLIGKLKVLEQVEGYLYSKSNFVADETKALYDIQNDYDKFSARLVIARNNLNTYKTSKNTAEKNLSDIVNSLTVNFDTEIKPLIFVSANPPTASDTQKIDSFRDYSSIVSSSLKTTTLGAFETQNERIEKLENFTNHINNFLSRFTTRLLLGTIIERYKEIEVIDFSVSSDKIKNYTFIIKPLKGDGTITNDSDIEKAEVKAVINSNAIPFVTTSFLIPTQLTLYNYS
jgi:hypothetical protein